MWRRYRLTCATASKVNHRCRINVKVYSGTFRAVYLIKHFRNDLTPVETAVRSFNDVANPKTQRSGNYTANCRQNQKQMDSATRLLSFRDTVAFVDTDSGELRHGPAMGSPSNVVLIRDGELMRIKFNGAEGQQDIEFLPDYSAVVGSPKARTKDTLVSTTAFSIVATAPGEFGLTADGKFLCSEPDGRITLSRPHCNAWERFHSSADTSNQFPRNTTLKN